MGDSRTVGHTAKPATTFHHVAAYLSCLTTPPGPNSQVFMARFNAELERLVSVVSAINGLLTLTEFCLPS